MTPRPLDWRSVHPTRSTATSRWPGSPGRHSYAESFVLLAEVGAIDGELARRLTPSAGMRNVLVQAYLDVDHEIVATAVPAAIEQYGQYTRQVARWFRDLGGAGRAQCSGS